MALYTVEIICHSWCKKGGFCYCMSVALTSITLVLGWLKSILKNIKFPLFIGISLTALYAFIFVIIQLENYALLVGSIGLFIILASVMYASRKIDWEQG